MFAPPSRDYGTTAPYEHNQPLTTEAFTYLYIQHIGVSVALFLLLCCAVDMLNRCIYGQQQMLRNAYEPVSTSRIN